MQGRGEVGILSSGAHAHHVGSGAVPRIRAGHSTGGTKMGLGGSEAEGSAETAQGYMGCGLVGVISWWLLHPSSPCCRHKSLSGMAGVQEAPTPLGQAEALALGQCIWRRGYWAEPPGVGRALGSGRALAEALRLFLFSYKQDRTQSSINLKNKKRAGRRVGCSRGPTQPPRPCSDPPPVV